MSYPTKFFKNLRKYYMSEEYSDLIVTCGGEAFNVHRVILCAQSGFFRRVCRVYVEEEPEVIDVPDNDIDIFEVLIKYVYKGKISVGSLKTVATSMIEALEKKRETQYPHTAKDYTLVINEGEFTATINKHNVLRGLTVWIYAKTEKIYLLAEKYEVEGLKLQALEWIENQVGELLEDPSLGYGVVALMLDDIFGQTLDTSDYTALKAPMLCLVVGFKNQDSMWAELQPMMRSHPDLAYGLANYFRCLIGKQCVDCLADRRCHLDVNDSLDVTKHRSCACGEGAGGKKRKLTDFEGDIDHRQDNIALVGLEWALQEVRYLQAATKSKGDH